MHQRRFGFLSAAAMVALAASPAAAQSSSPSPLIGTWVGEYVCSQGLTGVTLTITRGDPEDVRGLFHLYAPPTNPRVPTGCFDVAGRYDAATGQLSLYGGKWLLRPQTYVVVNFIGQLEAASGTFKGRPEGPGCTVFAVSRLSSTLPVPPACQDGTVAALDR